MFQVLSNFLEESRAELRTSEWSRNNWYNFVEEARLEESRQECKWNRKNVSCRGFKTEHDIAKSKPELNLGARSNLFDFYVISISYPLFTFYCPCASFVFMENPFFEH